MQLFARAHLVAREIEALLIARIGQAPPLVIGTNAYRRAMALIDVRDLMARIAEDPAQAFDRLY